MAAALVGPRYLAVDGADCVLQADGAVLSAVDEFGEGIRRVTCGGTVVAACAVQDWRCPATVTDWAVAVATDGDMVELYDELLRRPVFAFPVDGPVRAIALQPRTCHLWILTASGGIASYDPGSGRRLAVSEAFAHLPGSLEAGSASPRAVDLSAICIDQRSNVVLCDRGNGRILIYDGCTSRVGALVATASGLGRPAAACTDAKGQIIVVDNGNASGSGSSSDSGGASAGSARVVVFEPRVAAGAGGVARPLRQLATLRQDSSGRTFEQPYAVAVDSEGSLMVADGAAGFDFITSDFDGETGWGRCS
eukprot:g2665.t1